jgi:hypothetical protein
VRKTRMNTASLYRVVLLPLVLCRFTLGNGMEEVVGSIPTRSTKFFNNLEPKQVQLERLESVLHHP